MITLESVSKFFDSHLVLNNINLSIEKGKVYGIVGPNGAGKTTLFRCIAGFESYHGHIQSDSFPLKNHIGFLQTEPYYPDFLTAREYVTLMCLSRKRSMDNLDSSNVFDLPLDQYASTFSTGMKKKLALWAVLLQKNEFYILDEPYNGVDIQSTIIITEIIHRLKKNGKSIIISSHIFSTLEEVCDTIYLLKEGEIAKSVPKEEFKSLEEEMKQVVIGNQLDKLIM